MCSNVEEEKQDLISVAIPQDQLEQNTARASTITDCRTKTNDEEIPPKKRRTRRGKRRHPYLKNRGNRRKSGEAEKVIKPEAPHNSNQFLIEDHGNPQEIDLRLRNENHPGHARDSSFSMDSPDEIYSSPEDEEAFLQKDFNDTYEDVIVERLNAMSKSELIEEFLQQEKRNEPKRRPKTNIEPEVIRYKKELARVNSENESLKRENKQLRVQLYGSSDSGSIDSESDSSTSSTTSSSAISEPEQIDYTQTNGHSPSAVEIT